MGNGSHFAAVPPDRDPNPVREFGCWTAALRQMAEWRNSCRVDTVAVQATGVYWIPMFDILEPNGIPVVLVNAQHTKNVPGRKTGVQECQWLMKLHTYGLLRDSFRLEHGMEPVRTVWRVRDRHVKEAGRAIQHIQKALTKMNIQLANALSDLSGVSGHAIVRAIVNGERDVWKLADLCNPHVKATREEVARSLEGELEGRPAVRTAPGGERLRPHAAAVARMRRADPALSAQPAGADSADAGRRRCAGKRR